MIMSRSASLFVLLALAPLAACATASPPLAAASKPGPVTVKDSLPEPTAGATILGLYLAGNTAVSQGRADIATDYFAKAADEVDPAGSAFLREQAFGAAVLAGRIDQAAKLAPADGQGSTGNVRLGRLVVGVDALANGRGQAAYEALDPEKIGLPYRTAAILLRPWAAAAANNIDASLAQAETRGDPVAQAFGQQNHALLLERAGKIAEADAAFKSLMSQDTRIGVFSLAYGGFLERQGRRPEAATVYDVLLADRPDDGAAKAGRDRVKARKPGPAAPTVAQGAGEALLAIATTSLAQNQPANSIAFLRLSLDLDSRSSEALMLMGGFLEDQGNIPEARANFAAVPRSAFEYLGARSRLAISYLNSDENPKAVQIAQQAARDFPDDIQAQILLADTLRDTKDFAGSLPVLNKIIAGRGKDVSWQLYYSRAIVLEKTGQWPLAEKDLRAAMVLAPNQSELQNYLGYSWADRSENLPQALDLLKKAHQAQPNSGAILDSLGWAYYRNGDIKLAVSNLEQAVELAPAEADINDHLGDVYLKTGRKLEARYQWQRVLTLEAEPELRKAAAAKLAANPDDPERAVVAVSQGAPTP
jgi:tetratricopeptide (TPR) repeat protein